MEIRNLTTKLEKLDHKRHIYEVRIGELDSRVKFEITKDSDVRQEFAAVK
jgi:hypothetical protein